MRALNIYMRGKHGVVGKLAPGKEKGENSVFLAMATSSRQRFGACISSHSIAEINQSAYLTRKSRIYMYTQDRNGFREFESML